MEIKEDQAKGGGKALSEATAARESPLPLSSEEWGCFEDKRKTLGMTRLNTVGAEAGGS